MCRCCQNCWEDFYWNCIEERFCYDESIANYNPEEDEDYIASLKNGALNGRIQSAATDNNNLLQVPQPICDQPLRRGNSGLGLGLMSAKIHEEDYRRETQTNVPMVGPEILSVFAASQIFQDHQPTKINRISTKTYLTGIHTPNKDIPTTPRMSNEQDRLLRRLEVNGDATDNGKSVTLSPPMTNEPTATAKDNLETNTERRKCTFTLAPDSSPEGSQTLTPKKFEVIAEEEMNEKDNDNEVILRPKFERTSQASGLNTSNSSVGSSVAALPKRPLRSAKSVPQLMHVHGMSSDIDIFAITGSNGGVAGSQISMTPEVPSISYSNLPKNYEDTPTIEKYRVSQSLYSIQTANERYRATQDDYSMPRYFRRSAMLHGTQSTEMLAGGSSSLASGSVNSVSSSGDMRRPEKEKSKRMQMLRGNLPPLLIHSVSFKRNRDEAKQMD